jgi:hypothetical protein
MELRARRLSLKSVVEFFVMENKFVRGISDRLFLENSASDTYGTRDSLPLHTFGEIDFILYGGK